MRKTFKIFGILILGICTLAAVAEGISHFFLPPPLLPKLPMLKQIADPTVGYRLLPNQTAYSLDVIATTNKWGYRGNDWAIEKPAKTFRIVVLGASLTFGHGIRNQEIFTVKLEERLNQDPPTPGMVYEVLNFGVGGYDIGHSLHVLKEDALKFSPDLIILNLFVGDVFYIKDYSFYSEFFRIQEENFSRFRWELLNFFRRSRLAMFLWDNIKNHLWGRAPDEVSAMIQRYGIEGLNPLEGPNAEGWKFITERLRDYAETAQKAKVPAVFMILPTHEEISDPGAKSTYAEYLREKCEAYGIHYIGFLPEVRQNQQLVESFFIPYDFHFKKEGHAWIAGLLAKHLAPLIRAQIPDTLNA